MTRECKQIYLRINENQVQNTDDKVDCKVDNFLADSAKKVAILHQLARLDVLLLSHSGSNKGGSGLLPPSRPAHIIPFQRVLFNPGAWCNFLPFTVVPFVWPFSAPPQGWPNSSGNLGLETTVKTSAGDVNNNKDSEENDYESAGSDVIHLLTEEEANQFREPLVFYLIVRDDIS